MPTAYIVVMNQGIVVAALGADVLLTGYGKAEHAIQSCSGVIFYSSVSGAAGLYHFPAGDIEKDKGSRKVLKKIIELVVPDSVWICYGVSETHKVKSDKLMFGIETSPSGAFYNCREKLKNWMKGHVPQATLISEKAAKGGMAWLSQQNGVPQVSVVAEGLPNNLNDVSGYLAGNYQFGRILWK